MNTIPSTDIIVRPPANEVLPPGYRWVGHKPAKRVKARKYAPRNPAFAYLFT